MDETKALVEFTRYLNKVKDFDDELDKILEPIKDYSDTLGDIVAPVKSFFSIFTLAKKLKFKSFLKQYSKAIQNSNISEDYFKLMESYLRNRKNFEFIAEVIDSSIESKSTKCSALLGYFAAQVLENLIDVEYKHTVIVNALKIMVDEDLEYFIALYKKFRRSHDNKFRVHDMKEEFTNMGFPLFELENTIEKLKNIQVYGYDIGGWGGVGNAWGAFAFNKNTDYLWEVIVRSGVYF